MSDQSVTLRIFDNGGETIDRYTVVVIDHAAGTEDVYTMAEDPSVFNQYATTLDAYSTEGDDNETELDACPESIYAAVHQRMHGG